LNSKSFPFTDADVQPDIADICSLLNRLQVEGFQDRVVLKESDGERKDIDFW
jgi:hypothetical protein